MYQGGEEIQINWREMKWSNKIQNNDNLHKLRCFTVSRLSNRMKGNKKPCNKRHTKDKKKRMVQQFFEVLATQAITYETRPMKTRLSSLDLCFIPVMKMREEIHKSVFSSLNFWKFLRYCRYKNADRQMSRNVHRERRSVPLVLYFNHNFFFTGPLGIVFAEGTLPAVSFHATLYFSF